MINRLALLTPHTRRVGRTGGPIHAVRRYGVRLLFCTALAILLGLGAWQVSRGVEKSRLEAAWQDRPQASLPAPALPLADDQPYREVWLRGRWLSGRDFELDGRHLEGRIGVEVLSPFRLESGRVLLVNRGWRAQDEAAVPLPQGARQIRGTLYRPRPGFTLGPAYTDLAAWPRPVLYFAAGQFAEALGEPVAERLLVLDEDAPEALARRWRPQAFPAVRHYGYAVQWFGLALALLVCGWFARRRAR